MKNYLFFLLAVIFIFQPNNLSAQEVTEEKAWKFGGAVGLDFAQMLFVNPKFGSGEDKIGIGANVSFSAKYKKKRVSWDSFAGITFGIQRLGSFRKEIPFQKSVDELRILSNCSYAITETSPFGYTLDVLFLSQITPTYNGNLLSAATGTSDLPIAHFAAPATLIVSPGISFKKATKYGEFTAMLSPASLKLIMVSSDTIARLGLHGNPYTATGTEQEFIDNWHVKPDGQLWGGGYYSKNSIQFGATLKAGYSHKFFKYKEGDAEKHRLVVGTTINLYTNYLRNPQYIDVEWITNVDLFLFKGLSLSLMTNLSYDYDVMVQVDADDDVNTGVNGYESQDRRVSFLQTLLIKYNFLF